NSQNTASTAGPVRAEPPRSLRQTPMPPRPLLAPTRETSSCDSPEWRHPIRGIAPPLSPRPSHPEVGAARPPPPASLQPWSVGVDRQPTSLATSAVTAPCRRLTIHRNRQPSRYRPHYHPGR